MNRKNLLLFTFLVSQTKTLWAMLPLDNQPERSTFSALLSPQNPSGKVQSLKESLLTMQRAIEQYPTELLESKKIVLIGKSGSGKSTLLNFLCGKDLYTDDSGNLDTLDPVKGSEIGHKGTSETTFPSLCKGPNDIVLCDFPGFNDSGGAEKNLLHAWARYKLFKGEFKIMLAVDESDIKNRVTQFIDLMHDLTKTIPVEQLEGNIALLITKQGSNKYVKPHQKLKEMVGLTGMPALTDDVKKLLFHLTEDQTIHLRIPFFPCPNEIECAYDSQASRNKILESIDNLGFISNPKIKLHLPPESTLLINDLGKNLNAEVTTSFNKLHQKVVELTKMQTQAYASPDNLQALKVNLRSIQKALGLLENSDDKNILDFTHPLDHFFEGNNPIKEHVNTIVFLKTFKKMDYSKGTWARKLQLTIEEIHDCIDSLANKLCQKITNFVEIINDTIGCKTLPILNNEERNIEVLQTALKKINTVVERLQANSLENLIGFSNPVIDFLPESDRNSIEKCMDVLEFLKTLKKIDYPIGSWTGPLNFSKTRIQGQIDTQKNIVALKEQNKRLEEERRREEEAVRVESARKEEESRQAQALLYQEIARHQAQAEAERRFYDAEIARRDAEAQERQREIARQRGVEAEERRQEIARIEDALAIAQRDILAAQQEVQKLEAQNAIEKERQRLLALPHRTVITLNEYNLLPNNRKKAKTINHTSFIRNGQGKITKGIITPVTTYFTWRTGR